MLIRNSALNFPNSSVFFLFYFLHGFNSALHTTMKVVIFRSYKYALLSCNGLKTAQLLLSLTFKRFFWYFFTHFAFNHFLVFSLILLYSYSPYITARGDGGSLSKCDINLKKWCRCFLCAIDSQFCLNFSLNHIFFHINMISSVDNIKVV